MNKCLICGKELPENILKIIITEGENKYKSVCCSHEGSEELKNLLEKTPKEKADLYNKTRETVENLLENVEKELGREDALKILSSIVKEHDLYTASNLIEKDCEPFLTKSVLIDNQYTEGNEEAGYIDLVMALECVEEVLNCDDSEYGDVKFQYFVRAETDEEAKENEHDDRCIWYVKDERVEIKDLQIQFEMS